MSITTKAFRKIGVLILAFVLIFSSFPISARAESFKAVVTANKMVVRDGPTAASNELGYLKKGTIVTVHKYASGIAYIEYNGYFGFALVKDMTVASQQTSTAKSISGLGTVTVASLKVYQSPSASSKLLGALKRGTTITVKATNGTWAQLQNGTVIGYALMSGLSIQEGVSATPAPTQQAPDNKWTGEVKGYEAVVTSTSMKVYYSPSKSAGVYGTIDAGKFVVILNGDGTWAHIYLNGYTGYALLTDMRLTGRYFGNETAATPVPDSKWNGAVTGYAAIVTADSMNVYAAGSASAHKYGTLAKNTIVTVLDFNSEWAHIYYSGHAGYAQVSNMRLTGDYVGATASPSPSPSPSPTPAAVTPIWNGSTDGYEAIVTSSYMYVYPSSAINAQAYGRLAKGQLVTVLENDGTWAHIYLNGYAGYARVSDMRLTGRYNGTLPTGTPAAVTPSPTPYVNPTIIPTMSKSVFVNAASANVYLYATVNSQAINTLTAGFELTLLGVSGDWALVKHGNAQGYMLASSLMAVDDATLKSSVSITAYANADKTNVYQYASAYSKRYGTLERGTAVTVLSVTADWSLIALNGATGYVKTGELTAAQSIFPQLNETVSLPVTVNAGGAVVYEYASESSAKLGALAAGEQATLLGFDDAWCLIYRAGGKGYVKKTALTAVTYPTLTPNESYPAAVKIASAGVYEYASAQSKLLGNIAKGTVVKLVAHNAEWGLIELNGYKGYVSIASLYVQIDEFVSPTVKTVSATVVKSSVNAHKLALETSDVLGTLKMGMGVTVTAYTDKWVRINISGTDMYCLKSAVSTDQYDELKSGQSSGSNVKKLQLALENLGYFDGTPAGNYGSLTLSAVKRFQTRLGVDSTGNADINTLRVLYSGNAPASEVKSESLKLNDTGSAVLRLQTRLTYKGYMNATLDGEYGPITQKAVKLYQTKAGLTASGTADAATMASLFSSSAPANTSSAVTDGGSTGSTGGSGGTGSYSTDPSDDPASGSGSSKTETVIEYALAQLGKPYVYGTSGPSRFDCSGFTKYCYKMVGVSLNRSAQSVGYNNGQKIDSIDDLVRGDIVCFNTISDSDLSDHVGIYLGNKKFIHASSAAAKVVISSLSSGYYLRVFSWGRRVL